MPRSHSPAGTPLSFEQMMNIMVPKERCTVTFVNVADDVDGLERTHTFNPPYDMKAGRGYSFWISDDGEPHLWLVEQRGHLDYYFVREAMRVPAGDLH